MISERTKAALAAAKARGTKLGKSQWRRTPSAVEMLRRFRRLRKPRSAELWM